MELVKLIDKIHNSGLEWGLPTCCDPEKNSYTLLRAQMSGDIFFTTKSVYLGTAHNEKCRALLKLARQRNHDLVLFPEYCISYELLGEIAENPGLWPRNKKLWVLPCQGVTNDCFESFLTKYSNRSDIFVLDTAWTNREVNPKLFVNAFFYCFIAYREDKSVLCLVPQLKTHSMSDQDCLCETPGMTTGEIIFTINDRLLTLLCADSLNNEISWNKFQEEGLTGGLTILHPQLNPKPKDSVFSRLRWELYEHNESGVYITCNWAKGTTLSPPEENAPPVKTIHMSWSCIYQKHTDDISERWLQKHELRLANERFGLWGALMAVRRTEVWFSLYHEHALELNMPNPEAHGYAIVQLSDIHASAQYSYSAETSQWIASDVLASTLRQRVRAECAEYPELGAYCEELEDFFCFPLDTSEKYDADRFFSLALAESPKEILEIDHNERLIAWTQLLDEADLDCATTAMAKLLKLSHDLCSDDLKRLASGSQLTKNPRFCYQPAHDGRPSANLQTDEATLLVALADELMGARRHLKFLKKTECRDDDDLVRRFIRVLYHDPIRKGELRCLPELTTDITCGESVIREGKITDGGKESYS